MENAEPINEGTTDVAEERTEEPRRCCYCFPRLQGEALGLVFINVAMGSVVAANIFLGTALLDLARAEAGCIDLNVECEGEVSGGVHPDSLLTNIGWMGGLAIAVTLPIIGSITDFTPYRRQVGILSAILLVIINAAQIGTSEKTWWPMALLQVVAAWAFMVMSVTSKAYIPDLSDDIEKQNTYNSIFSGTNFSSMFLCTVFIVAMSMIPGVDDLSAARIGQGLLVVICSATLSYSWWHLMENKPAVDKVPQGSSVIFVGFQKIYLTSRQIWTRYMAIKWFFVTAMFAGAGEVGIVTALPTFAHVVLGMDPTTVGALALTVMVCGIPGSALSHWVSKRMDPLLSLMAALTLLTVTSAIGAAVLTSPDRQMIAFLFSLLWGAGLGWTVTSELTFFATALPSGAPAEFYGTWYFFTMILSWVPPLAFSLLNENDVNLQWGFGILSFFFFFALLALIPIGGFQKALDQVMEENDEVQASESGCPEYGRRRSSIAIQLVTTQHDITINN